MTCGRQNVPNHVIAHLLRDLWIASSQAPRNDGKCAALFYQSRENILFPPLLREGQGGGDISHPILSQVGEGVYFNYQTSL